MKALLGMVMAAALLSPAQASVRFVSPAPAGSPITQVADGCGPGFHRNPYGHCRPNRWERERERERRFERLECPRGYHLGPDARRCWPN